MLVSDFLQVERPFAAIRAQFGSSGPAWLVDSAIAAYEEGEQLSLRVCSGIGRVKLCKRVWAELSEPDVRPDRVIQRLTWRAASAANLFPSMEAELEFSPMGASLTSITFHGSYVPPLGPVGREMNRMLLHRVAEASVRAFLHRVARRLESDRAQASRRLGEPQLAGGC